MLYQEETNNQRDMYLVLLGQNGRQSRTRISTTQWNINACPMSNFSISPTMYGYVAAWPTKGAIYFAHVDKDGRMLAPGEIKTPGLAGMRTGLVALTAPDGTILIAWTHQDQFGWQLYDKEGRPQGPPGSVKSSGRGAAGVVSAKGQFLLFP